MATGDSLVTALRRTRPTTIRVVLADATTRDLAPPTGKRKRWAQTVSTLDAMPWVSIELLDVKGRIIEVFDNDLPATDLEDLGDVSDAGHVAGLLGLMLRAQDVALKRNQEQTAQLVGMNLKLCEVLMQRLVALEKGYAQNFRFAQGLVEKMAGDDDEGLLSSSAMEAMAPLLLSQVLGGGKPPPNGEVKKDSGE